MRILAILFLSSLLLHASKPAEAVLQVLEQAKVGKGNLKKLEGLAISPFCGPNKRKMIGQQWKSLSSWMKKENAEFSVESEQVDGDLAAVIVAGKGRSGPDGLRMLGFGLRQEEGEWKVAPFEGSFANAGIGFDESRRSRAHLLEQWIARERVKSGVKYRESELRRYLKALEGLVEVDVLKNAKPVEALMHFLDAASEGQEKELLVWQGMLERTVDDERDWNLLIHAGRVGLKGKDKQDVWRLLTDTSVIRLVVESDQDEESASVLVGFMAPFESGLDSEYNRVLRFHLFKHDAGWRVQMPAFFSHADKDASTHFTAHREEFNWRDQERTSELADLFEKKFKARTTKSPEELLTAVAADLQAGDYVKMVRFLYRHPDDAEEPEDEDHQETRYQEASRWWKKALGKNVSHQISRVISVKHHQKGDLALGVLQVEHAGLWEPTFRPLWMRHTPSGWVMLPGGERLATDTLPKKFSAPAKELAELYKKEKKDLKENAVKGVISQVRVLNLQKEAPSEEEAKALAQQWRQSLLDGKISEVLSRSAVVKMPKKPTRLLRDLSSSVKGAKAAVKEDRLIGVKAIGKFYGVSMMVDAGRGLEMHCPLMIVAPTEEGPCVLIDVELWLPTNKGKRMRNASNLLALKKELPEEDYKAIKELFDWHETVARPIWEAWEEEDKS